MLTASAPAAKLLHTVRNVLLLRFIYVFLFLSPRVGTFP